MSPGPERAELGADETGGVRGRVLREPETESAETRAAPLAPTLALVAARSVLAPLLPVLTVIALRPLIIVVVRDLGLQARNLALLSCVSKLSRRRDSACNAGHCAARVPETETRRRCRGLHAPRRELRPPKMQKSSQGRPPELGQCTWSCQTRTSTRRALQS